MKPKWPQGSGGEYRFTVCLGRTLVSYGGIVTGYVGTDCKAAASKKKRNTKRPVHWKGRPSGGGGWVEGSSPHPSLKGQGEGRGAYSVLCFDVSKWYVFSKYAPSA